MMHRANQMLHLKLKYIRGKAMHIYYTIIN